MREVEALLRPRAREARALARPVFGDAGEVVEEGGLNYSRPPLNRADVGEPDGEVLSRLDALPMDKAFVMRLVEAPSALVR